MTVAELEASLEEASAAWSKAQVAAGTAHQRATELRTRVSAGDDTISAAELAAADDEVDRTALLAAGKEAALGPLQEQLNAALLDQALDEIVTTLPTLGDEVEDALDELHRVLGRCESAMNRYNGFVRTSAVPTGSDSPRLRPGPQGPIVIDGLRVAPLRAHQHIVAAVLPTLQSLGIPGYVAGDLRLVAEGANAFATTRSH